MKKINKMALIISVILIWSSVFGITGVASSNKEMVYLGGMPAGFILNQRGADVLAVCDVVGEKGRVRSPAREVGIDAKDKILSLNNMEVNNAKDIYNVLEKYTKGKISIQIQRDNELINMEILPEREMSSKKYKIGMLIKESMAGIGTITYVKKDSKRFGALGHPVFKNNHLEIMKIVSGDVYNCNIIGVNPAEKGKPGELRGVFIRNNSVGKIDKNINSGIFGNMDKNFKTDNFDTIELGNKNDVKIGKAKIKTTIDGVNSRFYDINIVKADKNIKDNKNLVIKITDNNLLNNTGGILQGMSGSPIIQNGKLIGAVTHVFVNDASRGFGIFIDNMINE